MSEEKWEWIDEGNKIWHCGRWSIEQDGEAFLLILSDSNDSVIVKPCATFEECNLLASAIHAVLNGN